MLSQHLSKVNFHVPFFHERRVSMGEYASLYLTNTVRVMAVSLAGIFIPIYIFNISSDYLFFHQNTLINGFFWILSYYLIRSLSVCFSLLVFGRALFSKIHFHLSMIMSFFFLVFMIILWHLSKDNLFLIWAAAMFAGLEIMFYWVPYHIFFMRKSEGKDKNFGKSTGLRFSLTRLSSALAPAVGGLIIVNYGFGALFMASVVLLVIAALPITFAVHEWKHHDHNPIKVIRNYYFKEKKYKLLFTYFGEGMEQTIYAIFWPLLLFFVLQNFVNIGFINSLSFLVSSLTVLFIGKLIDKHGTKKIHAIGSLTNAVMYLPRMMFSNAILFYGLDIFDRFNSSTYSLPIMSLSYDKGKKLGESDYILFREFSLHLGMITVVFLASAFLLFFENWKWVFVLGMIGSLLTYLIELDKS